MATNKLLKFFSYYHLPPNVQDVSKQFCELATRIDQLIPESAEKTVCLRKLLEAKDAGVRAYLESIDMNQ